MKTLRYPVWFWVALLGITINACKENKPPPPLPSPTPSAEPSEPLKLEPDIATELPDVQEEPGKTVSSSRSNGRTTTKQPKGSLDACCSALEQNARSAPTQMQSYYYQAAALCKGAVATGNSGMGPAIKAALQNAKLPAGCL